jgi:hypothetical protein
MLVSCIPYSSLLKMEMPFSSEMSVEFQRITKRYIAEVSKTLLKESAMFGRSK